jgi:hypothetical protein
MVSYGSIRSFKMVNGIIYKKILLSFIFLFFVIVVPNIALSKYENFDKSENIIVMIDGYILDKYDEKLPIKGSGIIVGHNKNRIYIATADHNVRKFGTRP